ncbi:OmpA family protein [Bradyrhizobium prioriisuperbiae]|uniref:OmpA family protein n=1 Tax=Bradyrhizobium prioriisuperbiae TaxID=2854389 RepID=UPI0028E2B8F5|nr:OmpA family protein [Bradyrhizobium prioritasuperba]
MLKSFGKVNSTSGRATLVCATLLALTAGLAHAGDGVSADQIRDALTKPRISRSMTAPAPDATASAAQGKFVASLRNRPTRSLSLGEREQIATIAREKPAIDLEITFDYNSAEISQKAMPQVAALGQALSDPGLKGSTFVVAGHTDATGGEEYNQELSERRAESIKRHLVDKYGVAAADLVAVGYGKSKPKDAANPADPTNRRVEVVTMTDKTASK